MATRPPTYSVPVEAVLLLLACLSLAAPALYVWAFGL